MLTREDKIENFHSFIESEHFGIDTYKTIYLFNQNAHYSALTIDLYRDLIKRLDEKEPLANFTNDDLVRVNQTIMLDVLMKMQILIESALARFSTDGGIIQRLQFCTCDYDTI